MFLTLINRLRHPFACFAYYIQYSRCSPEDKLQHLHALSQKYDSYYGQLADAVRVSLPPPPGVIRGPLSPSTQP